MRSLGFESVACGSDGPEAWALAESWNSKWDEIRHDADAKKATQQLRRDLSQLFAEIRDLGRRVQHDIVAAAALAEGLRGCAHSIEVDLAALSKPDSQTQLPDIDWNGTTSEIPKSETTDRERATESESDAKSEQSNSDVTTSWNANGASATALNGSKHQALQNWVLWFSDFPTEGSELESARSIERRHAISGEAGIFQLGPRGRSTLHHTWSHQLNHRGRRGQQKHSRRGGDVVRPLHPNEPTFRGTDVLVRVGPKAAVPAATAQPLFLAPARCEMFRQERGSGMCRQHMLPGRLKES